jgi:hypothetical protein
MTLLIHLGFSKVKLWLSSWTLRNEDVWGIGGVAVYILNPAPEWSTSGSERLSCGKGNGTYCVRGWVNLTDGMDSVKKREIYCHRESNPDSLAVKRVAYRFIAWDIPAFY